MASVFCKTQAIKCNPLFVHDGKTYRDICTSDSIDDSGEKEEFFWCATEVDESNNMVNWGVCDLSTCKLNTNCKDKHFFNSLFTNIPQKVVVNYKLQYFWQSLLHNC